VAGSDHRGDGQARNGEALQEEKLKKLAVDHDTDIGRMIEKLDRFEKMSDLREGD
jgi:hypothetical protein